MSKSGGAATAAAEPPHILRYAAPTVKSAAMKQAQKFARIVVPLPLKEPLTYSIPEALEGRIAPGSRVLVQVQRRILTGVALDFSARSSLAETKPIIDLLDDQPILDQHLLKLGQWISQYYLASLGEVVATMLPPNSRRQSRKTVLLKDAQGAGADELGKKVIAELQRYRGKVTIGTLTRKFASESIGRTLARLEAAGAIEIGDHLAKQNRRKAPEFSTADPANNFIDTRFALTVEQDAALRAVAGRINIGGFETFLLHGVTGSGKTEVYLRAMERVRDLGRQSLIMIPEISLTPQLLDRLNARFPNRVGVLHSALTGAQRWTQWRQIASGLVDVVIGARSAVFAPIRNLGLIVVDEEHDASYKQEDGVRYNGRDVAVVRGKLQNCPVILGSATPALESYENCRQGRYNLLELTRRVADRPMPSIEAIDLRTELHTVSASGSGTTATGGRDVDLRLISAALAKALTENLRAGRQTLIFLNRRGFANFLQCKSCGYVWRCPYCSVTLTLHLTQSRLSCHHCDYRRPKTDVCPECKDPTLGPVGSGTERVEQALRRLVPHARVVRMDRDTTGRRGSHEEIIRRWEKGEIDILVGTQMITKGHDVFGVTLVGAILADLSLNLPDFRAAERTFQLLSQVAGRAGRGDDPGRVIVQTYSPDHYAVEYFVAHDYKSFFTAESEFRRALNYPPFGRLVNLRLDGPKFSEVETKAKNLADQLRKLQASNPAFGEQVEVLGPAPAPIEKLRNRYRWQLLLRSKQSSVLLKFARHAHDLMQPSRTVRLHIDVDPNSML
jgi:primosomal protein N' (replication factor Y)